MNKRKIGSEKEKIAIEYLKSNGYEILESNFYCGFGEIDIIAKDGDYLVFVEVKYRKDRASGLPEEAVGTRKQHRIFKSATYYLYKNRIPDTRPCRFDVVGILGTEVHLYKDAFSM